MKTSFFIIFLLTLLPISVLAEFPYDYQKENITKNWQKVRVEGHDKSYLRNPFRFIGYSIKAFRKKFTTSEEGKRYFDHQKATLGALARKEKSYPQEFSMEFVGDIMWLREGWKNFMNPKLLNHMKAQEIVIGNLETLLSRQHEVPTFPPARATFNSPPSLIDEFKKDDGKNIFSALSVANNHSLDYGKLGLLDTLRVLNERGIPWSGLRLAPMSKKRWLTLKQGETTIGFYAATYGMNNRWEEESDVDFNLLKNFAPLKENQEVDLTEVSDVLSEMKEAQIDIKIISLHWGFEYEYYPEALQVVVARDIVKEGADVIMGHHPHAQQPLDVCFLNGLEKSYTGELKKLASNSCLLKDKEGTQRKALIVYSLGNFLTNMYGFLSEVGSLLDLSWYQKEEGDWDWHSPKLTLIYNERENPKGQRETLFLKDYLNQNCFDKRCDKDDLENIEFLKGLYPPEIIQLAP